jgi:hypothetical protein
MTPLRGKLVSSRAHDFQRQSFSDTSGTVLSDTTVDSRMRLCGLVSLSLNGDNIQLTHTLAKESGLGLSMT